MSYGVEREAACPDCGYPLTVIDYSADPPPIPMRVPASVMRRDDPDAGWLSECPGCGAELDGEALLGREPFTPRGCVPVSGVQREIDRELRESEARFRDPDPFVRYAEHRRLKS